MHELSVPMVDHRPLNPSVRPEHPSGARRLAVRLLLIVAWLTLATPSPAAVASDAWITQRVKMSLLLSSEVNGTDIHVDSGLGRVTLFGTVSTDAEKIAAGRVAEQVLGVRTVRNLIAVVPAKERTVVEQSDETLRDNVGLALHEDPLLAGSDMHVESVDAGTVVIGGRAQNLGEVRRALWIARNVAGVRRVASVVEGPPDAPDADAWNRAMADANKETPARDMWLTAAVKAHLIANDRVPADDVFVDTEAGVVVLFGSVPTDAAKRTAQIVAAGVPGVRAVKNEILVRHPADDASGK